MTRSAERILKPGDDTATPGPVPGRPGQVVLIALCAIGAVSLAVTVLVWGSWLASGTVAPVDPGPDQMALWRQIAVLWVGQIGLPLAVLALYWHHVVGSLRRDGRLSLDGMILLALPLTWFIDPFYNYVNNWYFWNPHLVNVGSWGTHVPGWLAPNAQLVPEPLVLVCAYTLWYFTGMFVGVRVFRGIRKRFPTWGMTRLLAAGLAFCLAFDCFLETIAVATEWYNMPGGTPVIWQSGWHRLPLIEVLCGGVQFFMVVCFRFFVNDRGQTIAERGIEQLNIGAKAKALVLFVSLNGVFALAMFFGYNLPIQFQAVHTAEWPAGMPSYFTATCPAYKTDPASCGGPGRAIPRIGW